MIIKMNTLINALINFRLYVIYLYYSTDYQCINAVPPFLFLPHSQGVKSAVLAHPSGMHPALMYLQCKQA